MPHSHRDKCSYKHYPKCHDICTKPEDQLNKNSSFCMIDAPKTIQRAFKNKDELFSKIWSLLEPPDVSGTIPVIKPERLEKVRKLITEPGQVPIKNVDTLIEEELYIKFHPDRSITKIKSRTEIKLFPPSSSDSDSNSCCPKPYNPPPDCYDKPTAPCNPPKNLAIPSCKTLFTSTPYVCKPNKICPNGKRKN